MEGRLAFGLEHLQWSCVSFGNFISATSGLPHSCPDFHSRGNACVLSCQASNDFMRPKVGAVGPIGTSLWEHQRTFFTDSFAEGVFPDGYHLGSQSLWVGSLDLQALPFCPRLYFLKSALLLKNLFFHRYMYVVWAVKICGSLLKDILPLCGHGGPFEGSSCCSFCC